MIKKVGDKWALYSKDGKKLIAKHDSREKAVKQEQAIMASKQKTAISS